MKVTFRCKQSGNTVSFNNETDIASMRKEEGYDEVIGNEVIGNEVIEKEVIGNAMQSRENAHEEQKPQAATEEVRQRGRPRKENFSTLVI